MRLLSFACSRLKLIAFELVAGNKRTGIETSPKVILAVAIDRGAIAVASVRSTKPVRYAGRNCPCHSIDTAANVVPIAPRSRSEAPNRQKARRKGAFL